MSSTNTDTDMPDAPVAAPLTPPNPVPARPTDYTTPEAPSFSPLTPNNEVARATASTPLNPVTTRPADYITPEAPSFSPLTPIRRVGGSTDNRSPTAPHSTGDARVDIRATLQRMRRARLLGDNEAILEREAGIANSMHERFLARARQLEVNEGTTFVRATQQADLDLQALASPDYAPDYEAARMHSVRDRISLSNWLRMLGRGRVATLVERFRGLQPREERGRPERVSEHLCDIECMREMEQDQAEDDESEAHADDCGCEECKAEDGLSPSAGRPVKRVRFAE